MDTTPLTLVALLAFFAGKFLESNFFQVEERKKEIKKIKEKITTLKKVLELENRKAERNILVSQIEFELTILFYFGKQKNDMDIIKFVCAESTSQLLIDSGLDLWYEFEKNKSVTEVQKKSNPGE